VATAEIAAEAIIAGEDRDSVTIRRIMKNGAAILLLLLCACASSTTTSSNDADAYIRTAAQRYTSAFNAGDAATVASFYTDDAVLTPPNMPATQGIAAIRGAVSGFLASHPTLSFSPDSITQNGDTATERGRYTLTAGGQTDHGTYTAVWKRQADGTWKMSADTVVSASGR
jgi:uncharacterized protein (TIGR02246 family)